MAGNTFPESTLALSSLQPSDTPSLLDIRSYLQQAFRDPTQQQIFILIQQAIDNIQETLRTASGQLESLSIASADIGDLTVSGEFGPGSFQVLNGPPNFDVIGNIGSWPKATSVAITSIVAGLVTTAAPHELKPGDNVFIESTTVIGNTGFYVVATTPLATTFTVTGGIPGGNSTGGDMTKQFQGIWAKTAAFGGTAFDNAPFQVDVDGSLTITDATIIVHGSGADIVIDPVTGTIVVTEAGGGNRETIGGLGIILDDSTGTPTDKITMTKSQITMSSNDANLYEINLVTGGGEQIFAFTGTFGLSKLLDLFGYSGATGFGPVVSFTQQRGTGASPTATQITDVLGGNVMYGFDGVGESNNAASVLAVATQNHSVGSQGTKLIFEVTANGSNSPTVAAVLDQDSKLNVSGGYKSGGVAGLAVTRNFGTSVSVGTVSNGVFGTPGVGQVNGTVVNSVSLNTTANTFSGGILTA